MLVLTLYLIHSPMVAHWKLIGLPITFVTKIKWVRTITISKINAKNKFLISRSLTCTQLHELNFMQNLYSNFLSESSSPNNLILSLSLWKSLLEYIGILSVSLSEDCEEPIKFLQAFTQYYQGQSSDKNLHLFHWNHQN